MFLFPIAYFLLESKYRPIRFLFYGSGLQNPLTGTEFYLLFWIALAQSGIIKRVVPHTLRDSYVTHLLEMEANII